MNIISVIMLFYPSNPDVLRTIFAVPNVTLMNVAYSGIQYYSKLGDSEVDSYHPNSRDLKTNLNNCSMGRRVRAVRRSKQEIQLSMLRVMPCCKGHSVQVLRGLDSGEQNQQINSQKGALFLHVHAVFSPDILITSSHHLVTCPM